MTTKEQNEIFLQKRLRVIPPTKESEKNERIVATIQKNLESLGYAFSKRLFNHLKTCSLKSLSDFYAEIVPILRKMRGANVQYRPMYPNFPAQVMEASDFELYSNAVLHYYSSFFKDAGITDETWLPEYDKIERLPLDEKTSLDVIHIGNEDEFREIFTLISGSKTSITPVDKEILEKFVVTYRDATIYMFPKEIHHKETLCLLVSLLLKYTHVLNAFDAHVKTATDVLRIAVSLSGGDVSLATNTKFEHFGRKTRRLLLRLLDNCGNIKEDMSRYRGQWLRLGEILHPGEFKEKHPFAFEGFQALRRGDKIETFNSTTEFLIGVNELVLAGKKLSTRPGEFARRLDQLFRSAKKTERNQISRQFLSVADSVATPLLLQVYTHFKNRPVLPAQRAVFPKGNLAKMQVLEKELPFIDEKFCQDFASQIRNVLIEKFSTLEPLGKVYVDPELLNYNVPFAMRSASKSLRTLVRGSKLKLSGNQDTVRFFVHWQNCSDGTRVDLDLSAVLFDEDFRYPREIAYYNLRGIDGCHSGDITNAPAPHGASEFIDVNMSKVLANGMRYIGMCVFSFTEVPLVNLPICSAGWMLRKNVQSGEIFEPKTVQNRLDITANTNCSIPLLIDCKERRVIWMDIALKTCPTWVNARTNRASIGQQFQAITQLNKPNLYDLFTMHAMARGTLTEDAEEADQVFSVREGITPFDLDTIAAKFI